MLFADNMPPVNAEECTSSISAIRDALYVLNGKWKLPLIAALADADKPLRFNELQRVMENITPKVLSNELRELELNELVNRVVLPTTPVTITYELTPYSRTLNGVLEGLRVWGTEHKLRIISSRRSKLLSQSK